MKLLQVKINEKWEYVFAHNERRGTPIVTKNKKIALKARDLDYFKENFGNHEFRILNC